MQWRGTRPVFIDVGSFERLRPAEPWAGYRQFCMLFLYPLMLQAYKDLPFHAALRGSLDGIPPHDARAVLAGERFRKGVLSNVLLHARLEARYAASEGRAVKREMRRAGFSKELLAANFGKLEKLVRAAGVEGRRDGLDGLRRGQHLRRRPRRRARPAFVREAAARRRSALAWDVGCNDGRYARIAADSADLVVAFDADHATVDALYRRLREERREDILALVMSVTDPSPDLGWRGRERASLERRGTPELALCLAVVHHVCITGNVPGARVPRLAARARRGARDRVPGPRRPDGAAAAERQARGQQPRLRAGRTSSARSSSASRSSAREPVSETRTLYEARPRA